MKLLLPKSDFCLKELFENEIIRTHFISDVLGIPLKDIQSVKLRNPFLRRTYRRQKLGILDVPSAFWILIWTSGRITTVSIGSGTEPDMNFRMYLNYTPLNYGKKSPGTATWRTGYDFSMRKVRQI